MSLGAAAGLGRIALAVLVGGLLCAPSAMPSAAGPSLLVFTRTQGWHHTSIDAGVAALRRLATEQRMPFTATGNAQVFTERLAQADVVVFLNTTGDVLDDAQQAAFERYIRAGGGFVGVHSAADTEYDWPWYGALVGARFRRHGEVQAGRLHVVARAHPATRHLPASWTRVEEWYAFHDDPQGVELLMTLAAADTVDAEADQPIAWAHRHEGGCAFYTALGHTDESYRDAAFVEHLHGGIRWASACMR